MLFPEEASGRGNSEREPKTDPFLKAETGPENVGKKFTFMVFWKIFSDYTDELLNDSFFCNLFFISDKQVCV